MKLFALRAFLEAARQAPTPAHAAAQAASPHIFQAAAPEHAAAVDPPKAKIPVARNKL